MRKLLVLLISVALLAACRNGDPMGLDDPTPTPPPTVVHTPQTYFPLHGDVPPAPGEQYACWDATYGWHTCFGIRP